MRFTRGESHFLSKQKSFGEREVLLKKNTFYTLFNERLNIVEIEGKLSGDIQSLDPDRYELELLRRNVYDSLLHEFYTSRAYRRLMFLRRVSQQMRDGKFLQKFEDHFGGPERSIVIWGNSYHPGRTFSGHAPTVSANRFKYLLQRRGYTIREVSEFNSSKLCHQCKGVLEFACGRDEKSDVKFTQRLMRCQGDECSVGWVDRDYNASRNIAYIGYHIYEQGERPR